jgi:hypothetical protein
VGWDGAGGACLRAWETGRSSPSASPSEPSSAAGCGARRAARGRVESTSVESPSRESFFSALVSAPRLPGPPGRSPETALPRSLLRAALWTAARCSARSRSSSSSSSLLPSSTRRPPPPAPLLDVAHAGAPGPPPSAPETEDVFCIRPLPTRCAFFFAASSRCFSSWSSLYCVLSARERRFAAGVIVVVELSAPRAHQRSAGCSLQARGAGDRASVRLTPARSTGEALPRGPRRDMGRACTNFILGDRRFCALSALSRLVVLKLSAPRSRSDRVA